MTEHQVVWKVDVAIILGVIVGSAVLLYITKSLSKADDDTKRKEAITSEQ